MSQPPKGEGIMHRRLSSVCLSVCPVPDSSPEWKGVGSWNLAWRKPITRVTRDPILVSKGQRSRSPSRLMSWRKISHIFGTAKLTNFKLGTGMEYDDPRHRHARNSAGTVCNFLNTFYGNTARNVWAHHMFNI